MLARRRVLVGVTGGIAAYKACEIVRELRKQNAVVRVVMTAAATEFVRPLTFETLSGNPVLVGMFSEEGTRGTVHIEAARWPSCILICPATANVLGKVAAGIADDALTTTLCATTAPVIFCPAMNKEMYLNPIVQQNMKKLRGLGYHFVEPEKGELACGEEGWGRLAQKQKILDAVKKVLLGSEELAGQKVLVTAGRTDEPLDPVRIITNWASGKMGFALAEAAALRGATVTLVSGPTELDPFEDVKFKKVTTAAEMAAAVWQEFETTDILIMAAAVADFRPKKVSPHKIKKLVETQTVQLEKTEDILQRAGQKKEARILVGFAVETENGIANAKAKLAQKNLDLIVLNNPLEVGAGFATDTNKVTLIGKSGEVQDLPLMSKQEVARQILDRVIELKKTRNMNHACLTARQAHRRKTK